MFRKSVNNRGFRALDTHFSLIVDVAEVVGDAIDDDELDAGALLDDIALQTAHGLDQLLQRLQNESRLTSCKTTQLIFS